MAEGEGEGMVWDVVIKGVGEEGLRVARRQAHPPQSVDSCYSTIGISQGLQSSG